MIYAGISDFAETPAAGSCSSEPKDANAHSQIGSERSHILLRRSLGIWKDNPMAVPHTSPQKQEQPLYSKSDNRCLEALIGGEGVWVYIMICSCACNCRNTLKLASCILRQTLAMKSLKTASSGRACPVELGIIPYSALTFAPQVPL